MCEISLKNTVFFCRNKASVLIHLLLLGADSPAPETTVLYCLCRQSGELSSAARPPVPRAPWLLSSARRSLGRPDQSQLQPGDPSGLLLFGAIPSFHRCWRWSLWDWVKCSSFLKDRAGRKRWCYWERQHSLSNLWKHGLAFLWPVRRAFAFGAAWCDSLTFSSLVAWGFRYAYLPKMPLSWRECV